LNATKIKGELLSFLEKNNDLENENLKIKISFTGK
jgi:hypothetical protein